MDKQDRKDGCESIPTRITTRDVVDLIILESKISPLPRINNGGRYKELKENQVYVNRIFSEVQVNGYFTSFSSFYRFILENCNIPKYDYESKEKRYMDDFEIEEMFMDEAGPEREILRNDDNNQGKFYIVESTYREILSSIRRYSCISRLIKKLRIKILNKHFSARYIILTSLCCTKSLFEKFIRGNDGLFEYIFELKKGQTCVEVDMYTYMRNLRALFFDESGKNVGHDIIYEIKYDVDTLSENMCRFLGRYKNDLFGDVKNETLSVEYGKGELSNVFHCIEFKSYSVIEGSLDCLLQKAWQQTGCVFHYQNIYGCYERIQHSVHYYNIISNNGFYSTYAFDISNIYLYSMSIIIDKPVYDVTVFVKIGKENFVYFEMNGSKLEYKIMENTMIHDGIRTILIYFKSKTIEFFQVPVQVQYDICQLRTLKGKESMIEHKGLEVGQSGDLQRSLTQSLKGAIEGNYLRVRNYIIGSNYIWLHSSAHVDLSSLEYDILSGR